MIALSGEELTAWVERTSEGWRRLVAEHPEVLAFPCDVRETNTVAELLQHIVAVELRYAQRLHGLRQSTYDEISARSGEEIYRSHEQAMVLLQQLFDQRDFAWEEEIEFTTRSAGTLRATRRVILVHLLTHSVRHYAQLATLVRQRGVKAEAEMDYLFMGAQAVPS